MSTSTLAICPRLGRRTMTDHSPSRRSGGLTRRTLAGAAVGALGASAVVSSTDPAYAEEPFRAVTRRGKTPRPNILVIFADDLGAADLSVYGAPHIRTPNLDKL